MGPSRLPWPLSVALTLAATSPLARADSPPSTPAVGAPPLAPAAVPDPAPEPTAKAHVRVEGNEAALLRRRVGRFGKIVCASPCDTLVRFDPQDRFQVEGAFPVSPTFTLDDRSDRVLVRFKARNLPLEITGYGLLGGGLGSVLVAGSILLARILGTESPLSAGEKRGYYGFMIGGGAAAVLAIPLLVLAPGKIEVLPDPRRAVARGLLTVQF